MVDDALRTWLEYMRERGQTFCMVERVKVYVPTCKGRCVGQAEELRNRINDIMGGSTMWRAEGSWYNSKGELEIEPVLVIEAAYEPLCTDKAARFVNAIQEYIDATGEKAISIHAGNFYITDSPKIRPGWERYGGIFRD